MKSCLLCGGKFGNKIRLGERIIHAQRRKYCITCSPPDMHNTKVLHKVLRTTGVQRVCGCGEVDPSAFYKPSPHYQSLGITNPKCKKCVNRRSGEKQSARSVRIRLYLGGACIACGFSKWLSCLEIHHLNPSNKDPQAVNIRHWSWKRTLSEVRKCILLCRNCHSGWHNGEDVFEDRCKEAEQILCSS